MQTSTFISHVHLNVMGLSPPASHPPFHYESVHWDKVVEFSLFFTISIYTDPFVSSVLGICSVWMALWSTFNPFYGQHSLFSFSYWCFSTDIKHKNMKYSNESFCEYATGRVQWLATTQWKSFDVGRKGTGIWIMNPNNYSQSISNNSNSRTTFAIKHLVNIFIASSQRIETSSMKKYENKQLNVNSFTRLKYDNRFIFAINI